MTVSPAMLILMGYLPPEALRAAGYDEETCAGAERLSYAARTALVPSTPRTRGFADGRLTVRPPWEPAALTPLDVVVDPEGAFGTGVHATTRLCLELLLDTPEPSGTLVDVGCGSGVLAIVAARLGFSPVIALDYDPAAVTATEGNAARNDVEIDVRRFDLRETQVPDGRLVVANVLGAPLRAWAAAQARLPPELILSGLMSSEADSVAAAFAARGGRETERRHRAEWAALRLQFPSGSRPSPPSARLRAPLMWPPRV